MTRTNASRDQDPTLSLKYDEARHVRRFRSLSVARGLSLALVGVLTFIGVGFASATYRLEGNVTEAAVTDLLGSSRPTKVSNPDDPNAGQALNIVLMGSDDRGDGDVVDDGTEGMRSDTTIVMHISADRSRIELVSIPRDSYVDIPSCTLTGGGMTNPSSQRFNAAFAIGWSQGKDVASAAACAITTIESLTGVFIDGYAVIDFAGFEQMVDALGGVPICIPNDMDAPKADLKLEAGYQRLDGQQALGFARARTGVGVGDGSDTNRIGRQQELMSAVAGEVFNQNLLTDLPNLFSFLDAATSSLTADPSLASVKNLSGLAFSLRGIRSENILFMTVPWDPNPANKNEVVWDSSAPQIWENMANDVPLIVSEPEPESEDSSESTEPPSRTESNGSDTPDPSETPTKDAGKEPFTGADLTSECGVS